MGHADAEAAIRRLLAFAKVEQVVLDVDAMLVDVDSDDKQLARATFKGGFGFAPMLSVIEPVGMCGRAMSPRTTPVINSP